MGAPDPRRACGSNHPEVQHPQGSVHEILPALICRPALQRNAWLIFLFLMSFLNDP
jgi:hypothetical protein